MRSLVVVRGGDKSLHLQWWCDPKERAFDIALSYFGDNCEFWKDKCDYFHSFKGSKWEGLTDFIKRNWEVIIKYDFVWFPDDDIWMHPKDLERFFEICAENEFVISQPALMKGSFFSWDITCQNESCIYRTTNFIEIMAPCFKVDTFKFFAPTFAENTSGWGLEWLWWHVANKNSASNFAIIDLVPMLHTREVGTAGSGGAKNSPADEMRELLTKYQLKAETPLVFSENKRRVKRKFGFLYKKEEELKVGAQMSNYLTRRYLW